MNFSKNMLIFLCIKLLKMKTEKRIIGDIGEKVVVNFLLKKGYKIVEKNYLKKFGEIDIVAVLKKDLKNKK